MTALITVKGAVQGVGYRPFISQKATEYGLVGHVKNIGAAVDILVTGEESQIEAFVRCIKNEHPAGAFILDVQISYQEKEQEFDSFEIVDSMEIDLSKELPVFLPDIGICDECLREMLDSSDRRYRYPLISCTICGPRVSILDKLPYDRITTRMKAFDLCNSCESDYQKGRRHYAQTISCHDCGPYMILKEKDKVLTREEAVKRAIALLNEDKIIGLKGVSGYQFVCRPLDTVTRRLRLLKGREEKPFAVMFKDLEQIKEYCDVSPKEKEVLLSDARPIVLLNKKKDLPYEVCKDSSYIGAFLPSAGIHYLLLQETGPLIITSANLSDEPIIIKDQEYLDKFGDTTDAVLYHEREINIPQDDSVMYILKGSDQEEALFIRRSRGFFPLPVFHKANVGDQKVLSFGGDLKNTFSFGKGDRIIVSPYIGDLQDVACSENLSELIERFEGIFSFTPEKIVCDKHPLYRSGQLAKAYADKHNLPLEYVYHHHAHILSVMAENSLESAIGVSLDGTGFGDDGKIWGSEFMLCKGKEFERKGHLSYVKLAGGDNAPKKASIVRDAYMYQADDSSEINAIIKSALVNNINTYETSSMGRLFDGICSLLGIRDENSFEGECATLLEKEASSFDKKDYHKLTFRKEKLENGQVVFDQVGLFKEISVLFKDGVDRAELAYSFHMAICDMIVQMCEDIRNTSQEKKVCLSGGCFCNRLLLSESTRRLRDAGFEVYINRLVPCTDAGISLGQSYFGLL
ncbi:carbamoyltransferase HypF [Butyrivibrio proteoclasticus]|uniref:carbamoyltransferase HypF n=1 Tax=Butyrivibrio proteoclasticus TaxID=43305 RepID=UPI00054D0DCE|nr:carbamoyltransferase HypF [Butyrivibrio proteoclasticus]